MWAGDAPKAYQRSKQKSSSAKGQSVHQRERGRGRGSHMTSSFSGTSRTSQLRASKSSRTLRLAVSLCALSAVLALETISHAPVARAYSCINPHCYGEVDWPNYVPGTTTSIFIAQLNCNSSTSCDGFIDDEMWLVDQSSNTCKNDSAKACWVEIGYLRGDDSNYSENYFLGGLSPWRVIQVF